MESIVASQTSLSFNQLQLLDFDAIEYDFFGETIEPSVQFLIAIDPKRLFLMACRSLKAENHPAAGQNTFFEGLWDYDVAELFIEDPNTKGYLEINLAPNGCWWMSQFSDYRIRKPETSFENLAVETFSVQQEGEWLSGLAIPRNDFPIEIDWNKGFRGNVCSIVDAKPRRHLSVALLSSLTPDFHRREDFIALDICSDLGGE